MLYDELAGSWRLGLKVRSLDISVLVDTLDNSIFDDIPWEGDVESKGTLFQVTYVFQKYVFT